MMMPGVTRRLACRPMAFPPLTPGNGGLGKDEECPLNTWPGVAARRCQRERRGNLNLRGQKISGSPAGLKSRRRARPASGAPGAAGAQPE